MTEEPVKPLHQSLVIAGYFGMPCDGTASTIIAADSSMNSNDWSDEEVVRKIRDGRSDLFEVLVSRYKRFVYAIAIRHGGGRIQHADSFDITQRVWLNIWKWIGRSNSSHDENFRAFLAACVRNQTVSALRSQNAERRRTTGPNDDRAATAVDPSGNAGNATDACEYVDWLLQGLEPRVAMIVRLHLADGLTLQEIADCPDVRLSVAQVWRLLQRGIEQIRKQQRDFELP